MINHNGLHISKSTDSFLIRGQGEDQLVNGYRVRVTGHPAKLILFRWGKHWSVAEATTGITLTTSNSTKINAVEHAKHIIRARGWFDKLNKWRNELGLHWSDSIQQSIKDLTRGDE